MEAFWNLKAALWARMTLANRLVGFWRIVKKFSTAKYRYMTFPMDDKPV